MNWTNILAGLAQVLIPALVIYAENQGWLPTGGVASMLAVLAGAGASAATTKVTTGK